MHKPSVLLPSLLLPSHDTEVSHFQLLLIPTKARPARPSEGACADHDRACSSNRRAQRSRANLQVSDSRVAAAADCCEQLLRDIVRLDAVARHRPLQLHALVPAAA